MSTQRIDGHISQRFDEEMEGIVSDLLAMGELVTEQTESALFAFIRGDVALAQDVISKDTRINELELEIDDHCIQILARRQPAAGDLRAVVAIMKAIKDLERIGDQAKRIARIAVKLADADERYQKQYGEFELIGSHVISMLQNTLQAFREMDADKALAAALQDKSIDSDYEAILRQNMTYMMEDPRNITRIVEMTWVGRAIERIGDHARNVCEYTIYLVQGLDVRHKDDDQLQAIVQSRPKR
ncbi:phosphate signaling complex protein PhoU [Marinospirillum alkaliphilum]|uniref:Phosphate-specific transport system accessory protein PhoU n=1 Tax=Marinospirillum alkaliphilum DSM 21637 TaxID=1122209 RepID=A0A1K1WJX0_9GAMM|nr:phosphate signaling complex protein PhoU [Marinospirillum alkaliphilum]SFX37696.1 phosphate transport system protein [Marinospirillum alkaliphilum DSM 21637]